jgi:hypothetical protein
MNQALRETLQVSLTSWIWALLEKPPIVQLLKYFPAFNRTWRVVTMFTRALYWSISCATSIQSIPPHPISLRSILILSTTYVLLLLVVSFLLAFPPISYIYSCSLPFVLHALPILSSLWWRNIASLICRDSEIGLTTDYGLDDRGVGVRAPVLSRIFSSPNRPDWLWGPPNLLSNGDRGPFSRG